MYSSIVHTLRAACLTANQQPCQGDGLCDQHRKEFYSQHLNYAEKRSTSLPSPRRSETLGRHEHLSHPTAARAYHIKSNAPIKFSWREARIAQEQAGPTSILHHITYSEHIPAVGKGDIHSAEVILTRVILG